MKTPYKKGRRKRRDRGFQYYYKKSHYGPRKPRQRSTSPFLRSWGCCIPFIIFVSLCTISIITILNII